MVYKQFLNFDKAKGKRKEMELNRENWKSSAADLHPMDSITLGKHIYCPLMRFCLHKQLLSDVEMLQKLLQHNNTVLY